MDKLHTVPRAVTIRLRRNKTNEMAGGEFLAETSALGSKICSSKYNLGIPFTMVLKLSWQRPSLINSCDELNAVIPTKHKEPCCLPVKICSAICAEFLFARLHVHNF